MTKPAAAGTTPHEHRFNDVGSCVICGIAALYRCSTHGYAYDESCCGEDWRQTHLPATPSSPEIRRNEDGTPMEARDYVSWLIGTTIDYTLHPTPDRHQLAKKAEAECVALYVRQREEIERLTFERSRLIATWDAEIERLKADLLTPEEARVIVEYLDMGGRVERSERAHTIAKSADAKLRRLSSGQEIPSHEAG